MTPRKPGRRNEKGHFAGSARIRIRLARPERFERPTLWVVARYSIQLSYGRAVRAAHYTDGGVECKFTKEPKFRDWNLTPYGGG